MISQLTVFMENEKGRLAAVCRALADADINLHALVLADTADFGVLRLLCDTPEAAAEALRAQGWRAAVTPVLAVRIPNVPGSLASLLEFLDEKDVSVEYAYCFSMAGDVVYDILKVDDEETVATLLVEGGFALVSPEDVYEVDAT